MSANSEQVKVLLWATPRSLSTAFFRSISESPNVKSLLEPFSSSYYWSTDRVSPRFAHKAPSSGTTFAEVKASYENICTNVPVIFGKEMAYCLTPLQRRRHFIPEGFQHTFIIRHPSKAISSLYRMSASLNVADWTYFDSIEAGYKELHELFQYVQEKTKKTPIVIDADDLQCHPENTVLQYCHMTGIPFDQRMVNWSSKVNQEIYSPWKGWYEDVMNSSRINARKNVSSHGITEGLPQDVKDCIEESVVYYKKMQSFCLPICREVTENGIE